MGSDGEASKPTKRGSQASGGKSKSDDAEFAVGDAVLVRAPDDKSAFLPATIVRKHMSGEFTVEYTDSGKTEKYVKVERIQAKKRTSSKAKGSPSIEKGATVLYRHEETKKKWREGVVKVCREDGTFDIVDIETQRAVKKIPTEDVKKKRESSDDKANSEEHEEGWAVDDRVEYQFGSDKSWHRGRVVKKRKDGSYDISHESDDDEIAEKIPAKKIRKAGKKKGAKETKDESDEEKDASDADKSSSVRKRKSKRKESRQSGMDEEEEASDDEGSGSAEKKRIKGSGGSRGRRNTGQRMRFEQLRLHQLVEFEDDNGRLHRGYIKLLRKEDRECDIEHESDTERVSKRVPAAKIASVSMLSKLWGPTRNIQTYALNSRVYYRTKDGTERKGFVIKICRDEGKDSSSPAYDIEDELEGDVIRKVPASKMRPVPWINYPSISMPSLPSLPGLPSMPGMPGMPSMPSWSMLRKGMQVRVRQRDKETSRVTWQDGVILKLKKDSTCVVECTDSDGSKTKITVKNGDVRPKFNSPFAGITLPTLQLAYGLHPPKSSVEVLAEGKSKVYMGTVVSVNEAEKTYTILYTDGRKEKNVASQRVRLCLRKLRIGTEVEMIVEGPCKDVSKLDGEVAWVHRDEKVAVRVNGGNNDVFAEVCTHAIMVDGQPAFAAPLSSSWLEMVGFYANLALEITVFLWFCFGLCVEIGEMTALRDEIAPEVLNDPQHMMQFYQARQTKWQDCHHESINGTYLTIPTSFMLTDRAWLLAMITLKVLLTILCVGFSCRLVHNKISAIQDNYIDVKELQQDRVLRRHFARVMGVTIIVCFLTLLVYVSVLNRFDFYCLRGFDNLKLDTLSLHVDVFAVHTKYATTIDLVLALAAKSVFNLFRAVALHLLVFAFPHAGLIIRLLLWLPICIAVTALVSAMGVSALHVFYYVQRAEIVENAVDTLTTYVDWALVTVMVALWFNVAIVRLVVETGTYFDTMHSRQVNSRGDITEDLLDQAERGEFGLQAKQEALFSRVELKQEQLGVCKLSVLRVQRYFVLHIIGMIIGIISTSTLRGVVADEAPTVQAALTLHLVLCILWLIVVLLSSLAAIVVKREAPDLITYILDV